MFPECSLNVPEMFPECSRNVRGSVLMVPALAHPQTRLWAFRNKHAYAGTTDSPVGTHLRVLLVLTGRGTLAKSN